MNSKFSFRIKGETPLESALSDYMSAKIDVVGLRIRLAYLGYSHHQFLLIFFNVCAKYTYNKIG